VWNLTKCILAVFKVNTRMLYFSLSPLYIKYIILLYLLAVVSHSIATVYSWNGWTNIIVNLMRKHSGSLGDTLPKDIYQCVLFKLKIYRFIDVAINLLNLKLLPNILHTHCCTSV